MNSLALVIVLDLITLVLIAASLASRIPDFTFAGNMLGFVAFAVSLTMSFGARTSFGNERDRS